MDAFKCVYIAIPKRISADRFLYTILCGFPFMLFNAKRYYLFLWWNIFYIDIIFHSCIVWPSLHITKSILRCIFTRFHFYRRILFGVFVHFWSDCCWATERIFQISVFFSFLSLLFYWRYQHFAHKTLDSYAYTPQEEASVNERKQVFFSRLRLLLLQDSLCERKWKWK